MFGYSRTEKTDREEYLEYELERCREDERQRIEDEQRAREQREQERRERYEEEMRSADNWPEALRKQHTLFWREINEQARLDREYGLEPDTTDKEIDNWFEDGANACERALEIWQEVETENSARIDDLRKQIEAIENETRNTVADRLEKENDKSGWKSVAQALREDNPNNFLYW